MPPWLNLGCSGFAYPSLYYLWCLVLAALDKHWVEDPVWHSMVLKVPDQCGPSHSKGLGPSHVLGGPMAAKQDFCQQLAVWPLPVITP